ERSEPHRRPVTGGARSARPTLQRSEHQAVRARPGRTFDPGSLRPSVVVTRMHNDSAGRLPRDHGREMPDEAGDAPGSIQRENASMAEHDHRPPMGPGEHSRRDFLRGSGIAAASAVLTAQATAALEEAEAAEAALAALKVLSGETPLLL